MAIQFGFITGNTDDISGYETKRTMNEKVTIHQNKQSIIFSLTAIQTGR
jgi:hypothetical protein